MFNCVQLNCRSNLLRTLSEDVAEHCPNWFLAFIVYFPLSATVASHISRVYSFLEWLSLMFDVTDICNEREFGHVSIV